MSVFTLIENWEGRFKKNSYETVSYAKKIAIKFNSRLTVLTFSAKQPSELSKFFEIESQDSPQIPLPSFLSGDHNGSLDSAKSKVKTSRLEFRLSRSFLRKRQILFD